MIYKIEEFSQSLIGLPKSEGIDLFSANNYRLRIVQENGINFIITRDHRLDRINLVIKDNIIIDSYIG